MKSATSTTLPETPPGDLTAGIDWATDDHAVCILDGRGREMGRAVVEHTSAGLRELTRLLARHGPGLVIVHGGTEGVDLSFAEAAEDAGVEAEAHPA